ncbi:hypothetical protein ACFL3I_00865 [Pseudomonadota bacterium]
MHCSTKIFAKHFQKDGFYTSYLETPMDIGHIIKWKGYFDVWKNAPRWQDGVWVINPFSLVPLRDKFPFRSYGAASASYKLCFPSVRRLLRKGGMKDPDVIWASKPGSSVLKKMFPNAKLVMQVVDYYPAFRGDYIKAIEKMDYQLADHIFLIGYALVPYLTEELNIPKEKITVLGQGVSTDLYATLAELPTEYETIKGPRAVWVGVLDKCDPGLFKEAARKLGEVGGSMVLIGPEAEWAHELSRQTDNVHLIGPKASEDVPAYLQHADIGLMLYDRKRASVYKGQNPLKLYEYAAAGLSILSTPHEEFKQLNPPVLQISAENEIGGAIGYALKNRAKLTGECLEFAEKHAWSNVYAIARDKILTDLLQI